MEEVTKCRYIDCVDTREKEQILHELPVCDTGLCVRWLINSGHVDLIGSDLDALRSMKFFICNNHFTEDCYLSKGTLKENAVPFPHWSAVSRRLKSLKTRRRVQLNGQESSMEVEGTNQITEKNPPSEFAVDQWCRTCATKKENLVSMTSKGKSTDMNLLSKLKLLIEIDDGDALPTKMCDECVDKLEQSFKFFQQIYIADNTLRHVFPSARSSTALRKPLDSIGEHMRNEQQREKEEEMRQLQQKQQLQRLDDRAPRATRGIFRRGRGRPRSRGYAARARARQRSGYVPVAARNSYPSDTAAAMHESRLDETVLLGNESQNATITAGVDQQRSVDTVFSLLTDTCHSDEELDWSDVLKVMNDQRYWVTPRLQTVTKVYGRKKKPESQKVVESDTQPPSLQVTTANEESNGTEIKVKVEVENETNITNKTNESTEITEIPETRIEGKVKPADVTTGRDCGEETERRVSCDFCEQPFQVKHRLQTHLPGDHSETIGGYMCSNCLTCYESEVTLSNHHSLCHGDRREYRCEHCQAEFPLKRVLKEHMSKCQQLQNALSSMPASPSKQNTSEHSITRREDDDVQRTTGTTICVASLCPDLEIVDAKRDYKIEASRSPQHQSPKDIDETLVEGSSESAPAVEIAAAATRESSPVICPDCDEKMQDTMELDIHRMRRHSMNRKDATCLLCDDKSFASSEEYEQHVLDHCKRLRISPR